MADAEDIKLVPVKPRRSKFTLILMVLLLLTMGAAGFFGWKYMSGNAKPTVAAEGAPHAEDAEASEEAATDESGHGGSGEGERGAVSTILNFEPFLVNLADRDVSRYLRVTIRLQVINKSAAEKIATADVLTSQMRDTILGALSSKNSEQIVMSQGKDELKLEIAERLNAFLPGKPIKAVYFTDFVVQL